MNILASLFSILVVSAPGHVPCGGGTAGNSVSIQWSENKIITLPNCALIELRHEADAGGKSDSAKVYFRESEASERRYLFTVERSGTIYWDDKAARLLVQDRVGANEYRLLFFDLSKLAINAEPAKINEDILKQMKQSLKDGESIVQYWPAFVAWSHDTAIVLVDSAIGHQAGGSLASHCEGYVVSTADEHIVTRLSQNDLQTKYDARCPN